MPTFPVSADGGDAASPPLLELPMEVAPPTADRRRSRGGGSPLVASLAKLRDHLGPSGLPFGPARPLTFENSRTLAEMLDLPVIPDPDAASDEAEPVSPDPAPRLTLALGIVVESGAVDEIGNRLVPAASWDDESASCKWPSPSTPSSSSGRCGCRCPRRAVPRSA